MTGGFGWIRCVYGVSFFHHMSQFKQFGCAATSKGSSSRLLHSSRVPGLQALRLWGCFTYGCFHSHRGTPLHHPNFRFGFSLIFTIQLLWYPHDELETPFFVPANRFRSSDFLCQQTAGVSRRHPLLVR